MFKIQSIHGTNGVAHAIRYLGDRSTPAHTTLTSNGRAKPVSKNTPNARKIGDHYYLPNQNGIYHRNLLSWGVNLTGDNVHNAVTDANSITSLKHHKLQGLQLIISPKAKLDPYNPNQIYRFQRFINGVTKELYGKDYASYCAIQCDNSRLHSPHMHAHIITINTNMRNHKSITGKTYSVPNINKVIDHQIKLDNQRHPNHPIFTKPDISITPKQRIKAKIKDTPDLKLVNKAVNKVLKPGYTITNKRGKTKNISSNSTFRYALKQLGVEPYFKRHHSYYHDRNGNRIPVIKNGKVEHTKSGARKYKYNLVHGLSYRIISNKKHNRIINANKIAKLYPNCSYQHVHQALHSNYVRYLKKHRNAKATAKFDLHKMRKRHNPSPEYKRVHIYRPNDVRDVLPNLRNSIKHSVYNDLNEIEPVMAVNKPQGQHLKRTQHLYIQQPNPMERGMIRHYRNNLFGRLHRKFDKFKKKATIYKTKLVNAFHSEANKAGDWLNKHHLGRIGNWVKLKLGRRKSLTYRFNQQPITVSNQLQAQTGSRYAKNIKLAKRIELNNRRILTKREVSVRDVTNRPINVTDVINGLHDNKARSAFYVRRNELVPMLSNDKYNTVAKYSNRINTKLGQFTPNDVNLINQYEKQFHKRVNNKLANDKDIVFQTYVPEWKRYLASDLINRHDMRLAQQTNPTLTHTNFANFANSNKLNDNEKYIVHYEKLAFEKSKGYQFGDESAIKTYQHDKQAFKRTRIRQKLHNTIKTNTTYRNHRNLDNGPTLE